MHTRSLVYVCLAVLLSACATLRPDFETPTVQVVSVALLPLEDFSPRFAVTLRVMNPNRSALPLRGAAYTISIEGQEIVSGVTNDLPRIPGYGEEDVTLNATLNWLEGLQLLQDLSQNPRNSVAYELSAKLDVGALIPPIRITDTGVLSF
jgi:LEA14-like dessication related protein